MRSSATRRARHDLQRTPRDWMCPCGSTASFEEMPSCGGRICLRRWWLAFGLPVLVLILGLLLAGSTLWGYQFECPAGWVFDYGSACVRKP